MVSKEMKKYGKVAEVLAQKEYRKLEGLLKECLPNHVPIDIERVGNKIKLWTLKPTIMKNALDIARRLHEKFGTDAMSKLWERAGAKVKKEVTKKPKKKRRRATKKKVAEKK